jgi:hypothetical protein
LELSVQAIRLSLLDFVVLEKSVKVASDSVQAGEGRRLGEAFVDQ